MKASLVQIGWLLSVVPLGIWCVLTLLLSPALPEFLRLPLALTSGLVMVVSLFRWRKRSSIRVACLFIFVAVGALWASLEPSNDREWVTDVAKAPWA